MNQSTYNTLKSFIWGIANDCLVDVYDVGDYRKIILPMFVIRRFDAVLEPKHEEVIKAKEQFEKAGITELDAALSAVAEQAFVNKSDFILTDLKSRTNQQQLKKDFIAYLDGFSENVQVIINKFHIRNEIDRLSEQDRLGLLIEKFVDPRINLSNRPILNEDGSVKIEALDNHTMGTLFEEVIRMFNEETNVTDAGRHFTPRDIVELIADLAFIPIQDKIQSTTYRIYDGACGTGGMLTVGDQHIRELAAEQGKKVSIHLYGQENADETYAIARADMLVKGEGKESDQIRFGSTISDDKFAKEEFDFMLSNPPFKRAVEYYMAINKLLEERKSPYKAIIAFSGEITYEGVTYNETKLNGFPSSKIEKTFRKDPYRLLIVANKFQTGYDEPLLQTMYVDKGLADIKAVQTLSRLNRCHADKNDVFILDFQNDPADIKAAFDKYYKTTILSGETDVNKLNDLVDEMEPLEIYSDDEVAKVAEMYLDNEDRCEIDPIIDEAVERYKELEPDDQIDFKSSAKTFLRTYNFLSSILPYGSIEWEKLSIYLSFLVSKLPKPDTGNADEIIEDVELESYRLVAQDTISIKLEDVDSEIDPVPVKTDVGIPVPEYDTLSNILASFHEKWGNCGWTDEDRVRKQIADLPDIVAQDETYQNAMKYSDAQNARDESDRATYDAILKSLVSGTELYKAFSDDIRNKNNQSFKKWLLDYVFNVTYKPESRV